MEKLDVKRVATLYSIKMDEKDCERIYNQFLQEGAWAIEDAIYDFITTSPSAVYWYGDIDYHYDNIYDEIFNYLEKWSKENNCNVQEREGMTCDDWEWLAKYNGVTVEEAIDRW